MDPVSAIVVTLWALALFSRNSVQDVIYKKMRGEDPPYLVRRREREARRQARGPVAERSAAGRFFAEAWADAWDDAREKRARAHDKKREQRREDWKSQDEIDALADEAWEENKRRDAEKADRDAQRREAWQAIPDSCEACGKNVGKDNVTIAAVDGDLQWVCIDCAKPAAPAGPAPESAPAAAPAPKTTPDPNDTSAAKAGEEDTTADTTDPAAPGDPNPNDDGDDGATVTQMNDWRQFAASGTTTPEEILSVSGETTNLSAALAYTSGMADTHDQAASSAETSIASLTAGGVTGETLTLLAQAQELEGQAAAAYRAANAELTRHIQVQEAYNANQDAGNKQFVTQD